MKKSRVVATLAAMSLILSSGFTAHALDGNVQSQVKKSKAQIMMEFTGGEFGAGEPVLIFNQGFLRLPTVQTRSKLKLAGHLLMMCHIELGTPDDVISMISRYVELRDLVRKRDAEGRFLDDVTSGRIESLLNEARSRFAAIKKTEDTQRVGLLALVDLARKNANTLQDLIDSRQALINGERNAVAVYNSQAPVLEKKIKKDLKEIDWSQEVIDADRLIYGGESMDNLARGRAKRIKGITHYMKNLDRHKKKMLAKAFREDPGLADGNPLDTNVFAQNFVESIDDTISDLKWRRRGIYLAYAGAVAASSAFDLGDGVVKGAVSVKKAFNKIKLQLHQGNYKDINEAIQAGRVSKAEVAKAQVEIDAARVQISRLYMRISETLVAANKMETRIELLEKLSDGLLTPWFDREFFPRIR